MSKISRAYSYSDIEKRVFNTIKIENEDLQKHLGEPQLGNSDWFISGDTGEGKTSFIMQVVKELCKKHKVHYNSLEEGMKKSFKLALSRNHMKGVSKFNFSSENLIELSLRLSQHRQAKIVVIDSVQYFFRNLTTNDYFKFRKQFNDTTFIWISQAEGNTPIGNIARDIKFEADIYIHVKDFEAIVRKNRFEANKPYIIWEQGYNDRQIKLLTKG